MAQRLTNDERSTYEMKGRMSQYDEKIKSLFDGQTADLTQTLRDISSENNIAPDNKDPGFFDEFMRVIDDTNLKHAEDTGHDVEVGSDSYIGMELALARGEGREMIHATVRRRVNDKEGNPEGRAHSNPLLDSRKYEVEYSDGCVDELTANVIAENLIPQINEEGRRQMVMAEIMDHRVLPDALPLAVWGPM